MNLFDVSHKAGAIYYLIEQKQRLLVEEIAEQTNLKEAHILVALGWLVRDNRVFFADDGGALSVSLNRPLMPEIHY